MSYHIVLEGPENTRKTKCNNSNTLNSVKPLYNPLFYFWLENFSGSQVQGSITLLMVNMYELANQFGDKNREIYGSANENAKNDEIFPKFAAKIRIRYQRLNEEPTIIKNQQFND